MKKERELAELIFDKFRQVNCKENEVVPLRNINFDKNIMNLNPKEKDLFNIVLNGLIFTGYYTYESQGLNCFRLTRKGYDYIYDDEAKSVMLEKPWIIPSIENTNWDIAYNKLWKVIGDKDSAPFYIGGTKFYSFIQELSDEVSPTYSLYIEERRKSNLSTSRAVYYKDLINLLDEEKRFQLYINIQIFIEENNKFIENKSEKNDNLFIQNIFSDIKEEIANIQNEEVPKVFISYSWDDEQHKEWVMNLAEYLCKNGIDVILDRWELNELGKPLPNFMEKSIQDCKRVICIMTPNYKNKTDNLEGGVGYEYSIISANIFSNIQTTKFIPLLRKGNEDDAIPISLKGRLYIDMRDKDNFEDKRKELLRDIFKEPEFKKPPIGKKPNFN